MISNKDLNTALELIDNIVDQIRCINCDNSTSSRGKLSCGHVVCNKCKKLLPVCPSCDQSNSENFKCDPVLIKYSVHANTLLHVFQESVYNKYVIKSRISDQQKMEKELFPNCIQAPQKYFNKKKSINNKLSISNTSFPGENVSRASLKSSKRVEEWLEQNQTVLPSDRTPFTDLSVNSPMSSSTLKSKRVSLRNVQKLKINSNMSKEKSPTDDKALKVTTNVAVRKRSGSKTLSRYTSKLFKREPVMIPSTDDIKVESQKESLPASECDEVIVLEDSQPYYACEKDKQACLAVLEADKLVEVKGNTITISDDTDKSMTSQNVGDQTEKLQTIKSGNLWKIPFYKKGALHKKSQESVYSFDAAHLDNDGVSIVVETEDFVTKIEVTKCADDTATKSCQTDFIEDNIETVTSQQPSVTNNTVFNNQNEQLITKNNIESQDLFTCDKMIVGDVIEDSDMSSDGCTGNHLVTTVAQIHNAKVQSYRVLSPLNQTAAASRATAPKKRRYVASSDSSDKENRDPNITKKCKGKKPAKKRKIK